MMVLQPKDPPETLTLLLVMGSPCTGKTTLAKGILQSLQFVYLDNNFVADAFFQNTRTRPDYLAARPRLYNVLYRIAEENLKVANSVLLDVPHVRQVQTESWRKFIVDLATEYQAALSIVACRCSEETLRMRMTSRGEKRDRWKLDNWSQFLSQEPIDVRIDMPHIVVDTDQPMEANLARALSHIRKFAAGSSGTR